MTIIGIDLGTTNSLVSVWKDGEPVIIPNALGQNLTPSIVGVDDDGKILVGAIAKERLISHPDMTVSLFKRYMGSEKQFNLGGFTFHPEDIASLIIRTLKEDAEKLLGISVTEAVISVPAYFNDMQRKATLRAGFLAGLKVERLINEPTAAAIAYGLHERKEESTFLVFDLGGGTFDVSILEYFDGVLEVNATAGDSNLGGEDFVDLTCNELLLKLKQDPEKLDARSLNAFRNNIVEAKHELSTQLSTHIYFEGKEGADSIELSRAEFENINRELVKRLRHPIERSLRDASIHAKDLDDLILVGGATRMPLIRSLVSKMFGRLPTCSINPDEVVAKGAAIQAALKSRHKALDDIVLTDVCPHSLGLDVATMNNEGKWQSGRFLPIIERNTVIPTSRVESISTIYDNQKAIRISVYQGESRQVENNSKLGEFTVKMPAAPAGEQCVDVRYTYDINGVLEVEALVVDTGDTKRTIIQERKGNLTDQEIEKRLKELAALKIHPREHAQNRYLMAKGERLYEQLLGEARHEVSDLLQHFESVLDQQDVKKIERMRNKVAQQLKEIETERYL